MYPRISIDELSSTNSALESKADVSQVSAPKASQVSIAESIKSWPTYLLESGSPFLSELDLNSLVLTSKYYQTHLSQKLAQREAPVRLGARLLVSPTEETFIQFVREKYDISLTLASLSEFFARSSNPFIATARQWQKDFSKLIEEIGKVSSAKGKELEEKKPSQQQIPQGRKEKLELLKREADRLQKDLENIILELFLKDKARLPKIELPEFRDYYDLLFKQNLLVAAAIRDPSRYSPFSESPALLESLSPGSIVRLAKLSDSRAKLILKKVKPGQLNDNQIAEIKDFIFVYQNKKKKFLMHAEEFQKAYPDVHRYDNTSSLDLLRENLIGLQKFREDLQMIDIPAHADVEFFSKRKGRSSTTYFYSLDQVNQLERRTNKAILKILGQCGDPAKIITYWPHFLKQQSPFLSNSDLNNFALAGKYHQEHLREELAQREALVRLGARLLVSPTKATFTQFMLEQYGLILTIASIPGFYSISSNVGQSEAKQVQDDFSKLIEEISEVSSAKRKELEEKEPGLPALHLEPAARAEIPKEKLQAFKRKADQIQETIENKIIWITLSTGAQFLRWMPPLAEENRINNVLDEIELTGKKLTLRPSQQVQKMTEKQVKTGADVFSLPFAVRAIERNPGLSSIISGVSSYTYPVLEVFLKDKALLYKIELPAFRFYLNLLFKEHLLVTAAIKGEGSFSESSPLLECLSSENIVRLARISDVRAELVLARVKPGKLNEDQIKAIRDFIAVYKQRKESYLCLIQEFKENYPSVTNHDLSSVTSRLGGDLDRRELERHLALLRKNRIGIQMLRTQLKDLDSTLFIDGFTEEGRYAKFLLLDLEGLEKRSNEAILQIEWELICQDSEEEKLDLTQPSLSQTRNLEDTAIHESISPGVSSLSSAANSNDDDFEFIQPPPQTNVPESVGFFKKFLNASKAFFDPDSHPCRFLTITVGLGLFYYLYRSCCFRLSIPQSAVEETRAPMGTREIADRAGVKLISPVMQACLRPADSLNDSLDSQVGGSQPQSRVSLSASQVESSSTSLRIQKW